MEMNCLKISAIILVFFILSCNAKFQARNIQSNEESSQAPGPGDTDTPTPPGPGPQKIEACYPSGNCMETLALQPLPVDFIYPDPRTNQNFPANFDPDQYRAPIRFIDLLTNDLTQPVSQDFDGIEFLRPVNGPHGILSPLAIEKMQWIRSQAQSKIYITSAYRSPGHNGRISGSATFSRHMYGDAFDFASGDLSLDELKALCTQMGADFKQTYTTHIHCDWRNNELNSAFYPISNKQKNVSYEKIDTYLQNEGQINYSFINSKQIRLFAELPFQEDAGSLKQQWTVTTPKGKIITSEDEELKINISKAGIYNIKVNLGGTPLEVSLEF